MRAVVKEVVVESIVREVVRVTRGQTSTGRTAGGFNTLSSQIVDKVPQGAKASNDPFCSIRWVWATTCQLRTVAIPYDSVRRTNWRGEKTVTM